MANQKISGMTAIDAVSDGDLFEVVDDPTGTPVSKKATRTQVTSNCEKLANKGAASGYAGLGTDSRVAFATIKAASAASRILGRGAAGGAGDFEELTLGSGLSLTGTVLSATATGGGAAWTLVYEQVLAAQQNYDFIGLSAYNEIFIAGYNIAKGSAVTQCLVSTDNGSTFLSSSGDYQTIDNTTGSQAADTSMSCSGNNATTHSIMRLISFFNTTKPKFSGVMNSSGSNWSYIIPTASALNAIRVRTHQNTFTSGTIRIYGRS